MSISRDDSCSCALQLSGQCILDPRRENELFTFVTLVQHFGLTMNLGKQLSVVKRKPDLD